MGLWSEGMELAVNGSGHAYIAQLPNIVVCGKTGTAQNPHGQPHSVFIAFAPKNNPKIAIIGICGKRRIGGYLCSTHRQPDD